MSPRIETIAFRKCLNRRCRNYGGYWPAEIEACPMPECGMTGWLAGTMVKDLDKEAAEHAESSDDED